MEKRKLRDNSLDVLKAIMAIFIIFTHSAFSDNHRKWLLFPLIIDMAVPVFMIISGYVNSISSENTSIKEQYQLSRIWRKIKRILFPFLPIAVFDIFYWILIGKVGIKWTAINILFQQWGDGGYYPVVMIELIFAFPLIHSLSKHRKGIVSIVVLNIVTEVLFNLGARIGGTLGQVIVWIHRISITRYLVFILAGILLYRYREKANARNTVTFGVIGMATILILYFFVPNPVIFSLWRSTAFFVVSWPLSWVMFFIKNSDINKNKVIGLLGKASYHIFLVQMLYYFLINKNIINEPSYIVSIIACLFIGLCYYQLNSLKVKKNRG